MKTQTRLQVEKQAIRLEQFIDLAGRLVSWLVLGMVLLTFAIVIMRYLFDTGWIALQESVSYLHSMVFLIGAAYTLKYNEHVRVDIIYSRLSDRAKAVVELLGHIFILFPVMVFIIYISWPYVEAAWQVQESSREAGGLPGVYLLKSRIPVMAVLLIIQAVSLVLKALLKITQKESV